MTCAREEAEAAASWASASGPRAGEAGKGEAHRTRPPAGQAGCRAKSAKEAGMNPGVGPKMKKESFSKSFSISKFFFFS